MFCFLFTGYLVLEGFDYGVGMLLPFLGESDTERRVIISTLAPVWEGNEVWLIAAGTVLFAGFPPVYATLFSGGYLVLLLILSSLILRAVAFELRNKDSNQNWRNFWDWAIFCGSVIPALLWGMIVANLLNGLPINGQMQYAGTFGDLINFYTLAGGAVFVFIFLLHGTVFLTLKLDHSFVSRARNTGLIAGKYAIFIVGGFLVLTFVYTDLAAKPLAVGIAFIAAIALAFSRRGLKKQQYAQSFVFSTLAIVSITSAIFAGLFPRLIVSSLEPQWSLGIYNSAANLLALKIMTVTLSVVLPVVIVFEGWKYYIFRQRISITAADFESRRELWQQLQGRLKHLMGYYYDLNVSLEKTKDTLERGRSIQSSERAEANAVNQVHKFKFLIQRGRKMVDIIAEMIKILRK